MSTNKYLNTFESFKDYSDYESSLLAYFPNVAYVEGDGVYVNKTGLADYKMVFRTDNQNFDIKGVINVHYIDEDREQINGRNGFLNFVKAEDITEIPTDWSEAFYGKNFYDCRKWDIDMSGATNFGSMFANCDNLKSTSFAENWNVENVESFSQMFISCDKLERADLKNWVNEKATSIGYMFQSCYNLKYVDIRNLSSKNWDQNPLSLLNTIFDSCGEIKTLYIGERFFDWYTQNGQVIENTSLGWYFRYWTDIDSLTMFINAFPQRDTENYGVCSIGFPDQMYNTVSNNAELRATLQSKGYDIYLS